MAGKSVRVGGKVLALSNLNKIFYPNTGFTKGQVIEYYRQVSRYLLPHLKDRPITLNRLPDGVTGQRFYEKNAPSYTPDWIKTFPIARSNEASMIDYILINDLPTLLWTANLANLEMHPFLARVPHINRPTMVVFDLDPGDGADILRACEAAFLVKDLLDRLNLRSFVKVSGSKGIHMHVPLNTSVTYEASQPFAKSIAVALATEHANFIVAEMPKSKRAGKVFIDWSQNSEHKSTVAVYSLRARVDGPFVAMPVSWEELENALKRKERDGLFFTPQAALARLAKSGDLFAPLLKLKQKLPKPFLELMKSDPQSKETSSAGALESYRRKRDFSKTPEPPPSKSGSRSASGKLFVIQKHAASRLHYDFRLESGGTLKSWAVPKGPPYDLSERRLAMAVEDHPMEYARFEGVIPKGEYGGGTVMVWDIGTYDLIDGNYWQGKLHVRLRGKKLKGEWILVKGRDRSGKDNVWFLIKGGSAMPRPSAKQEDSSALTGRSMEKIAHARDAVWHSNKDNPQAALEIRRTAPAADLQDLPSAKVEFIEPMLAEAVSELPQNDTQWLYEMKLDGYRCLAGKDRRGVKLWSRRGNVLTKDFPGVARACEELPDDTLLDGELVAFDGDGKISFNLMQHHRSRAQAIRYYAFDLLVYQGRSLCNRELIERRKLLANLLDGMSEDIKLSESFVAAPSDLIRSTTEFGFEGIIAKRKHSLYKPGKRTGDWVKFKVNRSQELVIGGYTSDHPFDALIVGYYEGERLHFVAKVRNGFVPRVRQEVFQKFKPLVTDDCPFANLPEKRRTAWALTREEMKSCVWLKPQLVAQIEFTEWTPDGHLRAARFAGLREDKRAREVVREVS